MSDETKADAFRETIEVAEGPNVTGNDDMAKLAHALPPEESPQPRATDAPALPPATPVKED